MLLTQRSLLCCFACLLLLVTQAQVPGYKPFMIDEDNTAIRLSSIYKSQHGYLYAGTSNGLYQFNGKNFTLIEKEQPQMRDSVTAIFQDGQQQLWIGYQSGRIAKKAGTTLQYLHPEEGLPKKRITAFVQDQQQQLWFGTHGEGIYFFRNQRLYLVNEDNGMSDLNVHALAIAANGDVLAATDQGLNICSKNGNYQHVSVIDPRQGLPDYIITSISAAGKDEFWLGFQDKGFCLYNHATKKVTVPVATADWQNGQVNALLYDHAAVWIATQDGGLLRYGVADSTIVSIQLPQKNIIGMVKDPQGNLWLAADHQFVRTAGNRVTLLPLYGEDFAPTIHTILVDAAGNYWVGTDMALHRYANGVGKRYAIPGLDDKTDITSLYEDPYHNIWIGTMGKGIYVLNPSTGESRQLAEALNDGSNSILSISGNGQYVCTAGLEGAMVFELTDNNRSLAQQYHFTPYNNMETVGSTYIYSVYRDSRQRTWFATDGKGLTMLDQKGFTNFNKKSGLNDSHIYSITEDKNGTIWFSTSSAGIYSFDGKKFINYGIKEGLSTLSISSIRTDRLGNLVVVHKSGIDIFHPATGRFSYINAAQNIPAINDDLGAVCKDANGDVYFATSNGILKYSPEAAEQDYPGTIIESVQLFLNGVDTALHRFRYDENNFTFGFRGLYYSNATSVLYRYKLEGFDSTWQLTSDDIKTFPKLAPGKYLFRIQSSLNSSFINATEAVYAFEIQKPYWKQWWFIAGYLLLGVAIIFWYIKLREKNLRRVAHLQEEKIKFQFEVLRNQVNPHFLFNSFNTLISTIEDDPKAAVEYVEQLSDFFRNVVNYRDKDLIPLAEEKSLLASYLYMQQKRYGSSLQLDASLTDEERKSILIPPLTLQLLVENAIKHNVVSKEAVLHIRIFTKNGRIIVQNNVNPKISAEKGTGMGLQNIINRYAILVAMPVQVTHTAVDFTVSLPIIKQ